MRIYDGSPRQDFEEVFRSIGAHLDSAGMREILLLETDEGFIVQGLVIEGAGTWSEAMAKIAKRTLVLKDDELSTFMDQALALRGGGKAQAPDKYQSALRVIGRYLDDRRPRDVFFFEQEGAYVLRLLQTHQTGTRHELVEFTRDDITEMVARAPVQRSAGLQARIGATPGATPGSNPGGNPGGTPANGATGR
ncbi:MAG TPA: hypothetical protein VFP19_03965 [Candidatus Limnocylindrales bacterium]|nr:hypothetical protein [Candidatus Limnocylindrales bacterium]